MVTPYVIDLAFVLYAAWGMRQGYKRGFIATALDALGFVLALGASFALYGAAAELLGAQFDLPRTLAKPFAFFGIWVIAGYAASLASLFVYRRIPKAHRMSTVNRAFGLLPGLVDAAFTCAVALALTVALPVPTAIKTAIHASPSGDVLVRAGEAFDAAVTGALGDEARETLAFMTVSRESLDRIDLRFQTEGYVPDSSLEERMRAMVNAERAKEGLPALTFDAELLKIARAHAGDMLRRGYFSHISPEGTTPSGRADAVRFRYHWFGENLAFAPGLEEAHRGLMDSPGHRANILSPKFGRVGIGILDAGPYGLMVVQNFAD